MTSAALRLVVVLVLLVAPTLAVAGSLRDPARALDLIKPPRLRAAKAFDVPTPGNGRLALADLKGKVVLLNFWATWCPPCKQEMPGMERLHRKYQGKGLVVLAMSVDADPSTVTPFLKEYGLTFPVGLDPKMTVADEYKVRALPSTFIIDRSGNFVSMAIGPREWGGEASYALFESLLR